MQPREKMHLNFQDTRTKMGDKGRTYSDNQEIH